MKLDCQRVKMGKKNRLSRLINKWIKSDLPDDDLSATVLLLGVTRIPTSPAPTRRAGANLPPTPVTTIPHQSSTPLKHTFRKNSSSSSRRNNSFKSRKNPLGLNGNTVKHIFQNFDKDESNNHSPKVIEKSQKKGSQFLNNFFTNTSLLSASSNDVTKRHSFRGITLCDEKPFHLNQNKIEIITAPSRSSSKIVIHDHHDVINTEVVINDHARENFNPLSPISSNNFVSNSEMIMDRSVDSIGTCSLDVEAPIKYSDQSDASSTTALRSIQLTQSTQPYLPSYLSLACTINGYSTTTNYNSERLSKSRDASPHRFANGDLTVTPDQQQDSNLPQKNTVRHSLLSPPTVVPLPAKIRDKKMANHTMPQHDYFYTSSRISYQSHESKNNTYMGHYSTKFSSEATSSSSNSSFIKSFESRRIDSQTDSETSKSFIQQRVERLYGPGALAQGFFISKRLQGRSFDVSNSKVDVTDSNSKHSVSFDGDVNIDNSPIKHSSSSPTLPVLRHLRPEFRAQLPIISPKKSLDSVNQKNNGLINVKNDLKENGHVELISNGKSKLNGHGQEDKNNGISTDIKFNVDVLETIEPVKDGHYFLKILDTETERLLILADQIESELEKNESLSEEIKGKLRSASGKARLLTSQKMQQFRGLCANNISRSENEPFPTTNEDLQGFWDMVMLQVDQVNEIFKEIDQLRANNWTECQSKDVVDNGIKKANGCRNGTSKTKKQNNQSKTKTAASDESRKQRDALRKQMLEARRKAMKEQTNKDDIKIYVSETS